ncbi:MAG TPA: MEDS domain-containing protein [Acidimicrobiales bacterium]|nr:MEDS domain-containing protein [Acidimicrobiales bacterium]
MILSDDRSAVIERCRGSHVCWVVADPDDYTDLAEAILSDGVADRRKPVAFGPSGSDSLRVLADIVSAATDPRPAFLGGGMLDPDTMFAMFREQTAVARSEGYEALCLVADMDWLLPALPSVDSIVAFELFLDRVIGELDATVVCAYRTASFDSEAIGGALSVHPVSLGDEPEFRLVAGDVETWRLSGEVDLAGAAVFEAAFRAAARDAPCVVDVSDLEFIDVSGLRTIASVARERKNRVVFRRTSPVLRRVWQLGGFDSLAPNVELTA